MKVFHTLTKQFPNGTVSTWKFGQLRNGQFVAKGLETGTKRFFKSQAHMDARIRWMMWSCGYNKPSAMLVQQLALAL